MYCQTTEEHPTRMASIRLNWEMLIRMKRKFTDMVPLIEGSPTFIPELNTEARRYVKNGAGLVIPEIPSA
jgi:hypothetical protein